MITARMIKKQLQPIRKMANDFEIIRNNQSIGFVKAFVCGKDYPNTIQTVEETEILDNDCLVFQSKKYYVTNAQPKAFDNEVCYYMLEYSTDPKVSESNNRNEVNNVFHFNAPLNGTNVIGSHDFTLNIDNSIKNIQEIINNKTEDKEALQKLLDEIKEASVNNKPLTKGIFSKFSDLLAKHSDVAIAVGKFFVKLFF
ncbi:Uncharacterised protein [Sebaldella termitidis]|uniref:Uncharacterized protein n=1 Tax=Sebaldella termitidis (strain ATCC 33386 / NCTC 11300) TaxID=526218 RepID=D1AR10_SEBTE|nr:hypothetical protein [Sebaldella termitidis]ACZ07698.1 hypothetical protein Sterm_0826 [Sebaldella termitidis ATCC 33386]SUI22994.1 Uncharacterised protein [Sebaldella termitidis]